MSTATATCCVYTYHWCHMILLWNENRNYGLCLCFVCVSKPTWYPLVSYRNWASVCHATNALFLTTSMHAVQCMSVQSLNQLHNIYRPTVVQTHQQWILPELYWKLRKEIEKNAEKFLLLQQQMTKLNWLLIVHQ